LDRSGQVLLGKYELTRMLGKGGMGEVWEGEHQLTGRRVAVKVLSEAYLSNKKVVARFGREARAASSVQHEGIVEIIDQDRTAEGVPFLVMEFLEGETVGQRIKRQTKLSENEALAIMLPLLDALDAAHQAGVIHRDLKPDNVFILPGVRGEERIKILDFGISQKADEIEHRLTQEGSVLGTPHYMSPEQARGESSIDVRVDVYASAVLFYECVVGQVPFDANNYNALLQIIISRPPAPPRARGADINAALEQVVMAALSKRREERPPNVRVFRDLMLEAGMQHEVVQLDHQSWKFKSVPNGATVGARPSLPVRVPSPFELEADIFKPARTTGSFSLPRSARHMEAAWTNKPREPVGTPRAAAVTKPLRPKMASGQVARPIGSRASLDAHDSFPDLSLDAEAAARQPSLAAPSLELAVPVRPPQNTARALPRVVRQSGPTRAKAPKKRSWSSALLGWAAMVAAIALLVYVASAVFKRPDARKPRNLPEGTGATAPSSP
jgi:serine/threonine protein kinase